MSTLPVVEQILRETGNPMSVREIVEYAKGRLPTKSKTPDTVVARDLSMDIKKKGEASLFCRTAPGRYTMRALVDSQSRDDQGATDMVASSIKRERAGTIPASPAPAPDQGEVSSSSR
jgi:hypothetical protein